MIEPVDRIVNEEYTGPSRHASAKSGLDSDESFKMQQMSLGLTEAALLRDRLDPANSGVRSTQAPASMNTNTIEPSQLQTYFKAAMDKFIRYHEGQGGSHPVAQVGTTNSQE